MPEKGINNIVKFKDYHMKIIQPFMIIADFETYRNKLNQIKPYSFAMFTHCIFNKDNNELTCYTGKNCLDNFFTHLKHHLNKINKIKARPNIYSNPTEYKNNDNKTIFLSCNKEFLTDKRHAFCCYCKKQQDIFTDLNMVDKKEKIRKFDFRIILAYLAEKRSNFNISCIINSLETF